MCGGEGQGKVAQGARGGREGTTHGVLPRAEDALYGDARLPQDKGTEEELCRVCVDERVRDEAVQLVVAREVRVQREVEPVLRVGDGGRDRGDDRGENQGCVARVQRVVSSSLREADGDDEEERTSGERGAGEARCAHGWPECVEQSHSWGTS